MDAVPDLGRSIQKAREHYDSAKADEFYRLVWAGEDIYIGIGTYPAAEGTIEEACRRTVVNMADRLSHCGPGTRLLDLGSGYGAAARYLAREKHFQIDCLNLSEMQNEANRRLNRAAGLESQIQVHDGNFEKLPFAADSYDVIWSQDSFLHSGDRRRVFAEVDRVLKPSGDFIFSDLTQDPSSASSALTRVLARFHMQSLASLESYREMSQSFNWREVHTLDLSTHLVRHYKRLIQVVEDRRRELSDTFGHDFLDSLSRGMEAWVDASSQGDLKWELFHFRKAD